MSLTTWTTEQLFSLAHDHAMIGAAETTADPLKWVRLGRHSRGFWGEFSNRDNAPQQTAVTLPNNALSCDCPSRKYPCRHVLGLALLFQRSPHLFLIIDPPAWLKSEAGQTANHPDLAQQRKTYQQQLLKGLDASNAYALWLHDLIHSGLASLPQKPLNYWSNMAQRLAENGLYKLAAELRQLPALSKISQPKNVPAHTKAAQNKTPLIPKETSSIHDDWPTRVLQELSRHYLITQGFARYDQLDYNVQADLRYAAGWFANPDDPPQERLHEQWLVTGSRLELRQNENIHHTWLWGMESARFIQFARPFPRQEPAFQPLIVGTTGLATFDLLPSAWPFRVQVHKLHDFSSLGTPIPAATSLRAAQKGFSRALRANPWLDIFPLTLAQISVRREEGRWFLQDLEGYRWPLPNNFLYGWHLSALPAQDGAQLFGEWNGRFFTPLSFIEDSIWLPLHILQGIK